MSHVSIVVPLFNKADYIRRALDSVAHQTFGDFEVIIVDDGSTDGSEMIAGSYPDARFRVMHQENKGPGAARNAGIAEGTGELTACVWGYWGMWREARSIRATFRSPGDYRLRYYSSSWICSTPLGAGLGAMARRLLDGGKG